MDDLDVSRITVCDGRPVRMRRLRGGKMVVEGWNGVSWVRGPDAVDWADGRLVTPKELRAFGIRPDNRRR